MHPHERDVFSLGVAPVVGEQSWVVLYGGLLKRTLLVGAERALNTRREIRECSAQIADPVSFRDV